MSFKHLPATFGQSSQAAQLESNWIGFLWLVEKGSSPRAGLQIVLE